MDVIVQNISQLRMILLIACGIGFVVFFLGGLLSLRDLGRVSFRLERSTMIGRAVGSFMRALLCLLVGGAVFYVTGLGNRATTSAGTAGEAVANVAVTRAGAATSTPFTIVITPIPTADLVQAQAVAQAVAQATPITDPLSLPTPSLVDAALITVTATPFVSPTPEPQLAVIQLITPTESPATPTPLAIPTATSAAPAIATATSGAAAPGASVATLAPATSAAPAATVEIVPLGPLPTPTLAPTETSLPAAQSPATESNCTTPQLRLYKPAAGETIGGSYNIIGDAVFGSGKYKVEVVPASETSWRFIWEGYKKVQGESLMPPLFQTNIFPNGPYFMKLTLISPTGDEALRCVVPFNIQN